jgi:outer membrane lipoprotein SlyB
MQLKSISLRPLIIGAAASVIVASAVGVAAVTGLIPHSRGQSADEPSEEITKAQQRVDQADRRTKRAELRAEKAAQQLARTPIKPAARPVSTPHTTPTVLAQSAPTYEAPRPVLKPGLAGTVVSVREVEEAGDAKGVGAVAGGVTGAVLGHNIGEHNKLVTVLGAAGGAVLGHQIEKKARATTHWETSVRLDDGSVQTIASEAQPAYREGERVRVYQGTLQPV